MTNVNMVEEPVEDMVKGPVENMVEEPVEENFSAEITIAINAMKPSKAAEPFEVDVEIIAASGHVGEEVMRELFQRVSDGKGMPNNWKASVEVPIYKRKMS